MLTWVSPQCKLVHHQSCIEDTLVLPGRKCSSGTGEFYPGTLEDFTPVINTFEYLLRNGRTVVIFDGLDELLDTNRRQEISKDVESFCTLYPSVPIVVTSREVGYEQAPLDERSFEVFRLEPFDNEQVQEYVTKWFASDEDLTPEQKEQKAESFLEESSNVQDLRSNPLMLALMCNIYRGENYIPRNRPEVYEKCATMLFDRWDKSRGLYVTLPVDWHISPMMKYLAYWIYTGKELREGVTESHKVAPFVKTVERAILRATLLLFLK